MTKCNEIIKNEPLTHDTAHNGFSGFVSRKKVSVY